jgi:hypothetical protein
VTEASPPRAGVVYVATRDTRFIEEAALSAASLKRAAPDIPAWLYTDLAACALTRLDVFDRVVGIDARTDFAEAASNAKMDRLGVLNAPPFQHCLQLDTDTRICDGAIARAFDLLERVDIAMIECHPDSSFSRGAYGRPMFNGGFILFRRNDKTAALFRAWAELADRHFRLAETASMASVHDACPYLEPIEKLDDRAMLLRRDQLALAQLFSPEINRFDLDYAQLSEGWNYRGGGPRRHLAEAVIVDHRNAYKTTTAPDLLALAFDRFASDDRAAAGLIYNDVLARHAPDLEAAGPQQLAAGLQALEDAELRQMGQTAAAIIDRANPPLDWLTSALRIACLHLRAEQRERALKIGKALAERGGQSS